MNKLLTAVLIVFALTAIYSNIKQLELTKLQTAVSNLEKIKIEMETKVLQELLTPTIR